jgi:hypothetical protein
VARSSQSVTAKAPVNDRDLTFLGTDLQRAAQIANGNVMSVAHLSIPRCLRAVSAVRLSSAFVDQFAAWMASPLRSDERYLV